MIGLSDHWSSSVTKLWMAAPLMLYGCLYVYDDLVDFMLIIYGRASGLKVIGESLCLMTNYLAMEEKVMMANSRAEAAKTEGSRLRKDLV
nr:hypothetical protein CFP56_38001 [Quercus suber]